MCSRRVYYRAGVPAAPASLVGAVVRQRPQTPEGGPRLGQALPLDGRADTPHPRCPICIGPAYRLTLNRRRRFAGRLTRARDMIGSIRTPESRFRRVILAAVCGASLFGLGEELAAQDGRIVGRVVDAETGEAVPGASITLPGGENLHVTNDDGRFLISVAEGAHTLVISRIGYETMRMEGVEARVAAGPIEISLVPRSLQLNPMVVTASRTREKALEAPASVGSVSAFEMARISTLVPVEHVRSLPGVDAVRTGLNQHTVVARGFNAVMSGTLLTIVDNRYARVPSMRFNAHHMIPTTELDIERIEVSLGPGAALYGPNAASGVMHIVTTSPLDRTGTTVSLMGGERTVLHGQFRTAHALSDNLGFKISGQYFSGRDFEHEDPFEKAAALIDPSNPRIGNRLPLNKRGSVDGRVDWRFGGGSLVVAGGLNRTPSSIELSEIGALQGVDWTTWYAQARFSSGRFFAQLFHNGNNAGESYLLRTGKKLVDRSSSSSGQFQHGIELRDGAQSFIYGLDLTTTTPRTEGTINGRFEDDDDWVEVGGYLHSVTRLSERLDLVTALRIDRHARLDELNLSPRIALVVKPTADHSFRATVNRAFATPSTNNLFVDLPLSLIPMGPRALPFQLRGRGAVDGFTYGDRCESGYLSLCMYSPIVAGRLPANGTAVWNRLVDLVVPAELRALLYGPGGEGDPELVTVLRTFDLVAAQSGSTDPYVAVNGLPQGAEPLRSTIHNTAEIGYKGILGRKLLVSADLFAARARDFMGSLKIESPNVFLDAASVERFVLSRLQELIDQGAITPLRATTLARSLSSGALGTVAPDGEGSSDLVLSYRNYGEVEYWGADLGFRFLLDDRFQIDGSYSHLSSDCFDLNDDGSCGSVHDVAVNAPRHKGSVGAGFDDLERGLSARLKVRATGSFPMNSGVYIGKIDAYAVVDASVRFDLPGWAGTSIGLTGSNILNHRHTEFVGAPDIGRLLLLQLKREF